MLDSPDETLRKTRKRKKKKKKRAAKKATEQAAAAATGATVAAGPRTKESEDIRVPGFPNAVQIPAGSAL